MSFFPPLSSDLILHLKKATLFGGTEGPQILHGTRSTERRRDVWQQKETDNEIDTLEVVWREKYDKIWRWRKV
jgi:hypothetical protein